LDLTAQVDEVGSLAPRCGALFLAAFSGIAARVSAINFSVFSVVMPLMGFLSAMNIPPEL
jgi:hypothetical protein